MTDFELISQDLTSGEKYLIRSIVGDSINHKAPVNCLGCIFFRNKKHTCKLGYTVSPGLDCFISNDCQLLAIVKIDKIVIRNDYNKELLKTRLLAASEKLNK